MSRTQVAILPVSLASFWLGKNGEFLGIDSILTYGFLSICVLLNIYIEVRDTKNNP